MKNSKSGRIKPKFTYTLRAVFIIGTFAAVALSIFVGRVEQQKQIVKWVGSNGGSVTYSDQFDAKGNYLGVAQSNRLERMLGRDAIATVKEVFLEGQELKNIDPLSRLSRLESLYLNSTLLKNYDLLTSFRSLKSLSVSNISEPNISVIAKMVWLEHLSLDNCSCELEALSSLSNLKVLEIKRCETIDLNQIVKLYHLERLDLTMVKVKSLDPLTEATSLQVVNLVDVVSVEKSDGVADLQRKMPGCDINEVILGPF